MQYEHLSLPSYQSFTDSIAILSLPYSSSALHGQLCGFLCAGKDKQGEAFLLALLNQQKEEIKRSSIGVLFNLFTVSQQQISNNDFGFQMLLPDDHEEMYERAQAFSEWCEGFVDGINFSGIRMDNIDEECLEAFEHIKEFAELDCQSLEVQDEDEKALMEISEYTRIAVIRLHTELVMHHDEKTAH